ncbi:HAMP domain-containing sensor histidine kinase, partial [Desulfobacterales bacterium HSG17]|nr:HAMP domain-containing sensor histidine kinase [Desulfobacterales bacterium HSG17]
KRLNRLIEDFLLFARPAVPNFRKIDLNAMLQDHLDRFELQINGSNIDMRNNIPQIPCQMNADPDLLMRAIGNVLKNAVEATENKGQIKINVCTMNDQWILEIDDQGPGIEEERIGKIFEPFFTTRAKGTGLGLAFVKQVVTAHSGKVIAENCKDNGARFIFSLPLN